LPPFVPTPDPERQGPAPAPSPLTLLLPVLPSKNLRAWPGHEEGGRVAYQPPAVVLRQRYPSDAHFAAYSAPALPRRLDKNALGRVVGGSPLVVAMGACFVDVDGQGHQATDAWRQTEATKVARALAEHPGGFCYDTRHGYRLGWRLLAAPWLATGADAKAWSLRYWRTLLYLSRRFGIEGDPSCADWTRLYRAPHATRDEGGQPLDLATAGDPELATPLAFEPTEADLAADLVEARRLDEANPPRLGQDGRTTLAGPWRAARRALAPLGSTAVDEPPRSLLRPVARPRRPSLGERERLWCEKALTNLAASLARASQGGRNAAARDAGLILGHYAPHLLRPGAIEDALLEACEANGLVRDDGREAALTTLRRAIHDGMGEPKRPELPDDATGESPERLHPAPPQPTTATLGAGQAQAEATKAPGSGDDWRTGLQVDRTGYRKNLANVALLLSHEPSWAGCLAYDEFSDRLCLLRCPPSHTTLPAERWPRAWRDADDVRVALWLQREWRIEAGPELVAQAVVAVGHDQRVHPVRDYLHGLTWDGQPRLERWLTTYLGVRETVYSHTIGAMMLRAAVARVVTPGCKVDTMLVLQGEQGIGKSTAVKLLCGADWFTDDLADFGSKDAAMQLRGTWFLEIAELGAMARAEVERVKIFVSRSKERYRSAYGRHVQDQPRQCVFFGTTNAETYLRDETGNRRFWPVLCGAVQGIDLDGLARDRDQLWAEATAQVHAGLRWHLDPRQDVEALRQAKAAQSAVQERDAWENLICAYAAGKERVFLEAIFAEALGLKPERWGRSEQMRVAAILRRAGWSRHHLRTESGERVWAYLAPQPAP
jgi:hypothetical protein